MSIKDLRVKAPERAARPIPTTKLKINVVKVESLKLTVPCQLDKSGCPT